MMYKLMGGNMVQRVSDNAIIPFAMRNQDYQEYLTWVALGNTPTPADLPPAQSTKRADALQKLQDVVDDNTIPPKLRAMCQALRDAL
jgi:hypothetical protein